MRIWFACSLAMALTLVFDWNYGFLAVIVPVFVLNARPKRSISAILMVTFSIVFAAIEATFILELFQAHPVLFAIVVGISMLTKCIAMMYHVSHLFGFGGIVVSSMVYNLASYDFFDISDFNVNLLVLMLASMAIYALAYCFFPDREQPQIPPHPPEKSANDKVSQVAMGWLIAMLVFFVFQTMDLFDSLSALVSVLIILSPLTLTGTIGMGKVRVIGTGLGCLIGLALQIILGKWFGNTLLFWLGYTLAVGAIAKLFGKGLVQAGIGFSAIAALSVPLTTTLVPEQQDATFAYLYRFSSIFVAVLATTAVMYLIDRPLNRFSQKPQVN
ncbi:DUF2955 domain-containing protein [Endozoicomonas sp. G2_1]|uniref:DUF2955 domain-containing protein n=1 Tax=Endozoicomonas sp. G2_1 TaxID=2821091 RepID=UPI001ADA3C15|nr:DUF2955 domain-containing protein [Endozoicomonas sp. G2_1]